MEQKQYKVVMAKRADAMLLNHTEFLARVSIAAARRLLTDFRKTIKRISDNPFQFPFADEMDVPGIPPKQYKKCIFAKRYKALFLIDDGIVYLDAIIDCRQENKGVLTS